MAQSIRRGYCFVKYLYYLIYYNMNKNKFSLEQPLCEDCRVPFSGRGFLGTDAASPAFKR